MPLPNFDAWRYELQRPEWYHWWVATPEYRRLTDLPASDPDPHGRAELKEAVYTFFDAELAAGHVALAANGPNLDAERLPLNCAVLHHSGNPPGMPLDRLSTIQLLKLYAPAYAHHPAHVGRTVWSNHHRAGRPVFWAYHWFVRTDGNAERLLDDDRIGWHSGDWAHNCSSIGICLEGNYDGDAVPPYAMLVGVARLLRRYPSIPRQRILGHHRINPRTSCPGTLFEKGWRNTLLHLI